MTTTQNDNHRVDNRILKRNLWKFFKVLRVQANQIYCLLTASPIHYAWITIVSKSVPNTQKRITIAQFINSLSKMPSSEVSYQLNINLFFPGNNEHSSKKIFEATFINQLNIKNIEALYPAIVAFHCKDKMEQGKLLELSPQIIRQYKFKSRYINDLRIIIEECNNLLTKNSFINN